jgi:hypothetical protein
MKTTHYKFTTPDGRAFYVCDESKARNSAAKCGGTFHGPANSKEVGELIESALRPAPRKDQKR